MKDIGRDKGFTLVELLMAVFIGLILLGAVYVSISSGQRSSAGIERKVAAQQDVRGSLQTMGIELSMASYNPNYISGIWHDIPNPGEQINCVSSSNQANKGIRKATPTLIIVEMDLGESGSVGDQEGEIVRYEYDKDNQYIRRQTGNCGHSLGYGIPFLGSNPNASDPQPRSLRVINNNLDDPSRNIVNRRNDVAAFRYYNGIGTGGELFPDINPDDIPNIRRIDITLAVETEEVDPSTHQKKQMIYSTSVLVRNHVFN